MEKIDLQEVKRLIRLHKGLEKEPSRYEKKLAEIQVQMTARDILKDVTELKSMIQNIELDPGTEIKRYLFAFKGKFYLVEAGQYRKIEDAEVRTQLDQHSDTKIYYLCSDRICPMPPALSGRGHMEGVQVKDDAGAIDYIKKVSGVEVKKTDL